MYNISLQTYPERDRARKQGADQPDRGSQTEHHRQGRADCCDGPGGKLAKIDSIASISYV